MNVKKKIKSRECIRLCIGIALIIAIFAVGLYLHFYLEYQRISFVNWLFG